MKKEMLKNYAIVTLATFILGIAFNTTFLPLEIVIGGSSGLSIIADYFFGISPALVVFVIYMIAIFCGYFFLGKERIIKSVYGSFMYPFWIFVTSPLAEEIKSLTLSTSEYFVMLIIGSVVAGISFGLVYKIGYTTGGSDIASQIINKYFGMTIGSANLLINALIVISGGFIFGWTNVLYAVLALYIIGIATDKVLLGISYSKSFYIITDKVDDVKEFIFNEFKQTVTEFETTGGYSNSGNKLLLCVVPTRDYFRLKEGINVIDKDAFFVIMDAYQLEGKMS